MSIYQEIDNWIAQLDLPDGVEQRYVTHSGVGIYQYIERPNEKRSFKEKLAAEGLLKE